MRTCWQPWLAEARIDLAGTLCGFVPAAKSRAKAIGGKTDDFVVFTKADLVLGARIEKDEWARLLTKFVDCEAHLEIDYINVSQKADNLML